MVFILKGVKFNNHYRVLGDKEKIISVCDFIITCQAIFFIEKKNLVGIKDTTCSVRTVVAF